MPTCNFCSGNARCQGCGGRGVQFDGRTCALCGGNGVCQHCTNGQICAPAPDARLKRVKRVKRLLALLAAGTGLVAGSDAAWGQSLPTYQPILQPVCTLGTNPVPPVVCGGIGNNPTSVSSEERVVFNTPTTRTITADTVSTQIIGRISGGTPLYDRTFPVPISDPMAQLGLAAARAAITSAGGPGVIIGAPVLTASSRTTTTSSTTLFSLVGTSTIASAGVTVGPGSLQIGTRSRCAGISALPSTTAPTCAAVAPVAQLTYMQQPTTTAEGNLTYNINFRIAGDMTPGGLVIADTNSRIVQQDPTAVLLTVPSGFVETDIVTTTTYTIDQTTTTTNTTTLFEQYTLTGVVRRIGSVHALAAEAGGDAAGLFAARLRGAGDVQTRRGFWLAGYGWFGQRGAQGEIAADRRNGEGVTGGFATRLGGGFSAGVGFDTGTTRLRLPLVGESASVELTQAGVHLGWDHGPLLLRLAGTLGWGQITSATAPTDLIFATGARYDLRTASVSGEAGYALPLGRWTITPALGGEWRRSKTDAFAEPGTFGLSAGANETGWTRGWAGLALSRAAGADGVFRLYARATYDGRGRVRLPVSFTALGGAMMLDSPDYGAWGAEAGASADLALMPGLFLHAAYEARIEGNRTLHAATGGVKLVF